MAVKWAIANGNWNAGATWNGGTIPADGDTIYLNGKVVTLNIAPNYPNMTLRNDVCPDTGLQGGHITYNPVYGHTNWVFKRLIAKFETLAIALITTNYVNWTLTSDIEVDGVFAIEHQTGGSAVVNLRINGNITGNHSVINGNNKTYTTINITGNLTNTSLNECYLIESTGSLSTTLTHNGNCYKFNYYTQGITTGIINGNVIKSSPEMVLSLTLNGNLTANGGGFYGEIGTINGIITYSGATTGFAFCNYTIQNPDTFTWKDITEPRSNPFIILTDAELNNHQQYPSEADVRKDVKYAWGVLNGQLEQVQVGCVTKEDVREGVPLIGMYEDGQQVVGTIVIPNEEDVREGVHYDNDKIGTLIVQGGGDRLRIADFGYYTNAQSDTYIVDITEADKPTFAIAEENILRANCPKIDLNNIEDVYFERDFILFLKYAIIVEYYRSSGVNSQFSPSEPTTEIVNYDYSKIEGWRNKANMYLNFWQAKHPDLARPQKVRL